MVVNQELSNSFTGSVAGQEPAASSDFKGLDKKALWGLYAVYAAIGTVNGFFATYLNTPTICQYVFGPLGVNVQATQCNVAPTIFQMSWNFKLFFGFFLDNISFFGSRRKGWLLFGWTGGLVMLAFNAIMVNYYVEEHHFNYYMYSLMAMCIFYTFSDVAGDGLIIELSKFEPDDRRGYILTSCQMIRFCMMMVVTGYGMLFMSGKEYESQNPDPDEIVLPFQLPFNWIHWGLLLMATPFYVMMWMWLKDPPAADHSHPRGCGGLGASLGRTWTAMKSYAVFMLIVQNIGIQGIAGMLNPALAPVAMIANASNFQSSLGVFLGNAMFVAGVWLFRKYLIAYNWRITLIWTHGLISICGILAVMIVYDTWGISQNGWFYMFQSNIPSVIQGLCQVLSCLAVIEISPAGLESTIYELLISSMNGAMALSAALQSQLAAPFKVGAISLTEWNSNGCGTHSNVSRNDAACGKFETQMSSATWMTLGVNLLGVLIFMWFMPKNAAHCRKWAAVESWQNSWVALLNVLVFGVPFVYSIYTTFSFS